MIIKTSQIGLYDGIDVTRKSSSYELRGLTPHWDMIKNFKSGLLSRENYTRLYLDILQTFDGELAVERLVVRIKKEGLRILLCYCKPGAFCHRVLLARHLEQFGLEYGGEMGLADFPFDDPPPSSGN